MKTRIAMTSALICGACLLTATSSRAVTFNLRAGSFIRNVTVPGSPTPRAVLMWGFSLNGGALMSPGPALVVPYNDNTLIINLQNDLPEDVSIVIPGQNATVLGDPVRLVGDARRAASFTKVATAGGGIQTYTWTSVRPGTYFYHSGSHPALQVQMGLYGMLKKNHSSVLAYAGVPAAPLTQEVNWIFGEIDFDVHDAIQAGNYPTAIKSMLHSVPEVYLLNGAPLQVGQLMVGLPGFGTPPPTLVRMLNACYDERIPVVNGYHLKVVAEDGRQYPFAKTENAVNLPALKTRDAQLTAPRGTVVKFYERRLLTMK